MSIPSFFSKPEIFMKSKLPILKSKIAGSYEEFGRKMKSKLGQLKFSYQRYNSSFNFRTKNLIEETNRIINQISGYEECERLRRVVINCDEDFQRVKEELRQSRLNFDKAIQMRSQCQKELNALLQRKQAWIDEDLTRFTELYRQEIRLEQSEAEAKSLNETLEVKVDKSHQSLMDALRERYQEEQLWSDKIRRLSTFGTFSLMGLNVLLFLVIQLYLEPQKRKKFITQFHELMEERILSLENNITSKIESAPQSNIQEIPLSIKQNDGLFTRYFYKNHFAQGVATGISVYLLINLLSSSL